MRILKSIDPHLDFREGHLILIDKPLEWTSFDVVKKLRGCLCRFQEVKKLKVGHAGTLDPLATGLLVIATGKYTKELQHLQLLSKSYQGSLKLGSWTETYDAEGNEQAGEVGVDTISFQDVIKASQSFVGDIQQTPPLYSAVKIKGQRAYSIARRGKSVIMESRPVHVESWTLTDSNWPEVDFQVTCGTGTYIRSLAHDLGQSLKTGAYLTSLRRTEIGEFKIADAWKLENLVKLLEDKTTIL